MSFFYIKEIYNSYTGKDIGVEEGFSKTGLINGLFRQSYEASTLLSWYKNDILDGKTIAQYDSNKECLLLMYRNNKFIGTYTGVDMRSPFLPF